MKWIGTRLALLRYGVESGMREKQVCINVSVVCGKIEEANVFWMGDNNVFL